MNTKANRRPSRRVIAGATGAALAMVGGLLFYRSPSASPQQPAAQLESADARNHAHVHHTLTTGHDGSSLSPDHLRSESHYDLSAVPEGLTNAQVLDDLVHPPFVQGFVRGVVVTSGSKVSLDHGTATEPFLDYSLRVLGFVGPGENPYRPGQTITLRLPEATDADAESPVVAKGQTVYVLIRDQGQIGDGNTGTRVVATIAGQDVFYLADGVVTGQGRFDGRAWREPQAVFEQHFGRR